MYLEENNENVRRWFLFGEAFRADTLEGVGSNIVGSICIYWQERIIDFHVNNHILLGEKKNYQGKGYGTMIMHYIENEMLPDLPPGFKITNKNCRGEDKFSTFKQSVEEKIRSSLNVLVIGVDEFLIRELKAKGYKKIYNIKSYVAAVTFLEDHKDIAAHIHLVFFKKSDHQVYTEVRERLDAIFSYQFETYNSYLVNPIKKEHVHFHYWENEFPRIFSYDEPLLKGDNNVDVQYYSIVAHDWFKTTYTSYISYVEKQIFSLLKVGCLNREELPIALPFSKENRVKKLEDLRILLLVGSDNFSYFKEYFAKKGITHISLFQDSNSSYLCNALYQMGDVDIVIASDIFSYGLLSNYLEAKEQAKLCGRDTILLACYDDSSIYNGITLDNSVKYRLIDKEDVIRNNYIFRMIYDDDSSLPVHRDYEYVVARIAETVIREYLNFINSKGASISCEQFTTYQQLDNQCEEYIKNMLQEENRKAEEKQKEDLFYQKFDDLKSNLLRYLEVSRIPSIEKVEEVSIEEQSDYIRVCFLIKGTIRGALSIPTRKQENGRIFTLELQGKNGRLQPAHSVCLRYNEEDGDPSYVSPSEKELQFFEGICKRVDTYINPAVERALDNSNRPFVPRKKRNKRKMCYNDNRR